MSRTELARAASLTTGALGAGLSGSSARHSCCVHLNSKPSSFVVLSVTMKLILYGQSEAEHSQSTVRFLEVHLLRSLPHEKHTSEQTNRTTGQGPAVYHVDAVYR